MPADELGANLPPEGRENPWEHSLEEIDTPRKNEVSVGGVLERMHQFQMNNKIWDKKDVREDIKREIDYEEPILRGPVEVAKGQSLIMAFNYEQGVALDTLYNINLSSILGKSYALVESTGKDPKKIEAQLKFVAIKPTTNDHLVISQGLASQLGLETGKEIRILDVYQKMADIDLDKL